MRAGRLAPARTLRVVRGVSVTPSRTGAIYRVPTGAPPMRRRLGYPVAPQERLTTMPTEARRVAMLPAAPPPGPARPPKEPLFEAIMRQLREKRAGPATQVLAVRPAFATPGRPFAAAAPAPAPIAAGFDMKKLVLPLALVAGAFVVSKLI